MLKLADTSITMPGGWRYVDPTGAQIRGGTFNDLILKVLDYRVANMLPTENVAAEVEEWICRETNARCKVIAPSPSGEVRNITGSDVWRFLKTMGEWMKDRTVVSQEEADSRSETCAGCVRQVPIPDNCFGCSKLAALIFAAIGERRTRFESQLQACGVCGCANSAAVWVPLDVLKKSSGDLEYPEDTGARDADGNAIPCWKR